MFHALTNRDPYALFTCGLRGLGVARRIGTPAMKRLSTLWRIMRATVSVFRGLFNGPFRAGRQLALSLVLIGLFAIDAFGQQPPNPGLGGSPFVNGFASGTTEFRSKSNVLVGRINWTV